MLKIRKGPNLGPRLETAGAESWTGRILAQNILVHALGWYTIPQLEIAMVHDILAQNLG
jgi:hypothetical protein